METKDSGFAVQSTTQDIMAIADTDAKLMAAFEAKQRLPSALEIEEEDEACVDQPMMEDAAPAMASDLAVNAEIERQKVIDIGNSRVVDRTVAVAEQISPQGPTPSEIESKTDQGRNSTTTQKNRCENTEATYAEATGYSVETLEPNKQLNTADIEVADERSGKMQQSQEASKPYANDSAQNEPTLLETSQAKIS